MAGQEGEEGRRATPSGSRNQSLMRAWVARAQMASSWNLNLHGIPPAAGALDGGTGPLPPTMVLLVCSSEVSLLGVSGAHMSLRPWLRAQQEWARSPGPHQLKGSVPTGGAPAGHCGRA